MSGDTRPSPFSKIKTAVGLFCGGLLFLAVTLNMAEIVIRVFFRQSLDLLFDLPVWITVWAMLLITGFLLPEGTHVSIDFVKEKIKGRPRQALEVILALATFAYGAFLTWSSLLFLTYLYQKKSVFPRSIPIPTWVVQLCVPIGMAIFTAFAFIALARAWRQRG
jgi:TRAP-type C4-dicarboxylate transport system permease small subunit